MIDIDRNILKERYDKHPGRAILLRFKQLDASLYMLNENYKRLKYFIDTYKKSDSKKIEIIKPGNQDNYLKYLLEITRLFHNYVASVYSLIDHTRKYYNKFYKSKSLFNDYQEKVDTTFKNNPLAIFIKDLRQYYQHYSIPNIYLDCIFNQDDSINIYLKIEIKTLLKYDGWSKHALEFIQGYDSKDDIDLENIIDSYNDLALKFQKWFRDNEILIHRDDLDDLEKVKNDLFRN